MVDNSDILGLTEGKIVNYVLPDGRNKRQIRPAIVVRVWRDVAPELIAKGYCNLQVFTDGNNDYPDSNGLLWATSKIYSEEHEPGTWHWGSASFPIGAFGLVESRGN